MRFPAGMASFTCSTRLASFQRVSVFGTRGRLELELPFNPPTDRPHRALLEADGGSEHIEFDICDQYGIQADLFSRAILDDTEVLTPIQDAVANMRVIDALVRSSDLDSCERPVTAKSQRATHGTNSRPLRNGFVRLNGVAATPFTRNQVR